MNNLDRHQLEFLKIKLLQNKRELTEQLKISEQASGVVTLDQTSVGRVSRMDAMQQQSMALSTRRKVQSRLQKIEIALHAMTESDYGFCKQCDESIGYNRLEIQPETALCLDCQNKADQQ